MRPVTDSDARSPRRAARPASSPSLPASLASATQGPASGEPAAAADPASPRPDASPSAPSGLPRVTKPKMAPIGPEALRALRERIRAGQYPSDEVVRDGLERLIRRPN